MWHIEKFLATFDWFLVLTQFMGEHFSSTPSGEFSELPCQSPQLGNTGKYTASRAGPIWKNPVLG